MSAKLPANIAFGVIAKHVVQNILYHFCGAGITQGWCHLCHTASESVLIPIGCLWQATQAAQVCLIQQTGHHCPRAPSIQVCSRHL